MRPHALQACALVVVHKLERVIIGGAVDVMEAAQLCPGLLPLLVTRWWGAKNGRD